MRVTYPNRASLAPVDRNAERVLKSYNELGVSPHTVTERVSYTVPAGRVAEIDVIDICMVRYTLPTTSGRFEVSVNIYPGGGSPVLVARRHTATNTAFEGIMEHLTGPLLLYEGDIISVSTWDTSTDGSTAITISIYGIEYDRI